MAQALGARPLVQAAAQSPVWAPQAQNLVQAQWAHPLVLAVAQPLVQASGSGLLGPTSGSGMNPTIDKTL